MAERAKTSAGDRSYKRSWKNLLINKRYQLRFTLFMVGLSSLLMIALGIWVMKEANEATAVGMDSVLGVACGPLELAPPPGSASADDAPTDDTPPTPLHLPEAGEGSATGSAGSATGSAAAMGSAAGGAMGSAAGSATGSAGSAAGSAGSAAGSGMDSDMPTHHRVVHMDESEMTMIPAPKPVAPPPPTAAQVTAAEVSVFASHVCAAVQHAHGQHLEFNRMKIFVVLILTGLALVIGLAVYGIKMTHKVAGPLFKVTLYLNKMRDGRFDKVWNLRKGDQLIDFYDHFKAAHAGMVTMEKDDIERANAVIAAAEASGLGAHPSIVALRELVARKEKALA